MLKTLYLDARVIKEISKFPHGVIIRIDEAIKILERDGKLVEPYAKKVDKELFEIRIKHQGQWRVLYAYTKGSVIIILTAFQKKTQKLPQYFAKRAYKRLKEYTQ